MQPGRRGAGNRYGESSQLSHEMSAGAERLGNQANLTDLLDQPIDGVRCRGCSLVTAQRILRFAK